MKKKQKEIKDLFRCFSNNEFRMKIIEELLKVESLEKNYGFLSSIGIKLLIPEHDYEIEGFIKALDNTPYRNGIFNFIIKYPKDYPNKSPRIYMKTRIFHCNASRDGDCCIVEPLRHEWKKIFELPSILSFLFQFCINNNPLSSFDMEVANLCRNNPSSFDKKCEVYVNQYALREFDLTRKYLFEEYYNNKIQFPKSEFTLLFIDSNLEPIRLTVLNKDTFHEILKDDFRRYLNADFNMISVIIGNKAFNSVNEFYEKRDSDDLNYHIIFGNQRIRT